MSHTTLKELLDVHLIWLLPTGFFVKTFHHYTQVCMNFGEYAYLCIQPSEPATSKMCTVGGNSRLLDLCIYIKCIEVSAYLRDW